MFVCFYLNLQEMTLSHVHFSRFCPRLSWVNNLGAVLGNGKWWKKLCCYHHDRSSHWGLQLELGPADTLTVTQGGRVRLRTSTTVGFEVCCSKPPSFWWIVTAVLGNSHSNWTRDKKTAGALAARKTHQPVPPAPSLHWPVPGTGHGGDSCPARLLQGPATCQPWPRWMSWHGAARPASSCQVGQETQKDPGLGAGADMWAPFERGCRRRP